MHQSPKSKNVLQPHDRPFHVGSEISIRSTSSSSTLSRPNTHIDRNRSQISCRSTIARPPPTVLRLPCMYTKQINKKRKVWSDGILKVVIDGDIYHCTLLDAEDVRGIGLDSRQLEPAEVVRFKNRQAHNLEMENYIVDVIFDDLSSTGAPSLKLPKFVPPSRYIPPHHPPKQELRKNMSQNHNLGDVKLQTGGRAYRVTDGELDDIWGNEASSGNRNSMDCLRNDNYGNDVPQLTTESSWRHSDFSHPSDAAFKIDSTSKRHSPSIGSANKTVQGSNIFRGSDTISQDKKKYNISKKGHQQDWPLAEPSPLVADLPQKNSSAAKLVESMFTNPRTDSSDGWVIDDVWGGDVTSAHLSFMTTAHSKVSSLNCTNSHKQNHCEIDESIWD